MPQGSQWLSKHLREKFSLSVSFDCILKYTSIIGFFEIDICILIVWQDGRLTRFISP